MTARRRCNVSGMPSRGGSWKPLTVPLRKSGNFSSACRNSTRNTAPGGCPSACPRRCATATRALEGLVEQHLPASHAALAAASRGLFFSLPVAFDPAESVGPYLAIVDRDAGGQPYRFLDMGALIATHAFGENDPAVVQSDSRIAAIRDVALRALRVPDRPVAAPQSRAERASRRPARRAISSSTPAPRRSRTRSKSVLMNRVMTSEDGEGGFIVSFEGAFHGRTLGSPRRHAPQESAAGLSHLRLAAHLVSGRRGRVHPRKPRAARNAA